MGRHPPLRTGIGQILASATLPLAVPEVRGLEAGVEPCHRRVARGAGGQIECGEALGAGGSEVHAVAAATVLPIVLHGNYSIPLLEKLLRIESIAALKEDITLVVSEFFLDSQVAGSEFRPRFSLSRQRGP